MSKEKDVKRFIAIGIVLFVIAFIIWLYPTITMASVNGKLEMLQLKENLTEADKELRSNLQYNLVWWEMMQATLFFPLASILIVIAIALIVYGVATKYLLT